MPTEFPAGKTSLTECLLKLPRAQPAATQAPGPCRAGSLTVTVRFLQVVAREIGELSGPGTNWDGANFRMVAELRVGEELYQAWQEALTRRIEAPPLKLEASQASRQTLRFRFPAMRALEPICHEGKQVGVIVRRQAALEGSLEIEARPIDSDVFQVSARILNQTPLSASEALSSEGVLLRTFASTQTLLSAPGCEFISLLDPAAEYRQAAAECKNLGTWPVLVGDPEKDERDRMLSSPIILYDYPQIAPESAGPLFDGTEIDEILTLRIQTLTEREKLEMRNVEQQARQLLERTERLPRESLLKMHGTLRDPKLPLQPGEQKKSASDEGKAVTSAAAHAGVENLAAENGAAVEFDDFFGASKRLDVVQRGGCAVRRGDRVRIRPKARADIFDTAVDGRTAMVEAIEEDLEHQVHLAVVFDHDPGKDLGLLRQPGHRFFYGLDEIEPLMEAGV